MNYLLFIRFFFFQDLDPCLGVHCESFGVCKTYGPHEARCVCNEDCPSYQDPVCTANGTTYDNRCLYELSYCRGLENGTIYHPGSCEGRSAPSKTRHLLFKKWKPCTVILFSHHSRKTSGSLGEREMLWEHEPQASVSIPCTRVFS